MSLSPAALATALVLLLSSGCLGDSATPQMVPTPSPSPGRISSDGTIELPDNALLNWTSLTTFRLDAPRVRTETRAERVVPIPIGVTYVKVAAQLFTDDPAFVTFANTEAAGQRVWDEIALDVQSPQGSVLYVGTGNRVQTLNSGAPLTELERATVPAADPPDPLYFRTFGWGGAYAKVEVWTSNVRLEDNP